MSDINGKTKYREVGEEHKDSVSEFGYHDAGQNFTEGPL